jgi:succinoglycan biosynthesis transport protein ExoP
MTPTSEIDLLQLVRMLRRQIWIILGIVLVGMVVATPIVLRLPKQYTAEAIVVLNNRNSKIADLQSSVSRPLISMPDGLAVIRTEIDTISSPALVERVVKEQHLQDQPEFNPTIAPRSTGLWDDALRRLREGVVALKSVVIGDTPETLRSLSADPLRATAERAQRALSVVNDGASYLLKIRFRARDPRLAADVANAFASIYLREQQNVKLATTRSAAEWLGHRIQELEGEVLRSDQEFLNFREQNHLTEANGATLIDRQINEVNAQLAAASLSTTKADANARELRQQIKSQGAADDTSSILQSPLIQRLREREVQLQSRVADLSTRFLDSYSPLVEARAQLRDTQRAIDSEVRKVVHSAASDYGAAKAQEESLRKQLANLEEKRNRLTGAEVQLRVLERNANANRALYVSYLEKYKEIQPQEHSQEPDARLLSTAQIPLRPSSPASSTLEGLALLALIGIAIVIALVVGWFRNGFNSFEELEELGPVRNFGLIPELGRRSRPVNLLASSPLSAYPEAVQSVYAALQCSKRENPDKVLLVTSALPGEGKSVFAASLARGMALAGKRALLVDCDLRQPSVAKLFDEPHAQMLSAQFAQSHDLSKIVMRDELSGLDYIAVRPERGSIQAVLTSPQMLSMIDQARARYDYVVIDTPPMLPVSDTLLLSSIADNTLLVVRWEHTPRTVVRHVVKLLRDNHVPLAGVLLTRVNMRKHARYNYGDAAYFHTKYGSRHA